MINKLKLMINKNSNHNIFLFLLSSFLLIFFLFEVSQFNLHPLFLWNGGKFWGWESSAIYFLNENFKNPLLYKDVKLVYPFGGIYLIDFVSNLLNISLLRAENLIVYLSAFLSGLSVYIISLRLKLKDIAFPISVFFTLLCINVVNPIVYNSVSLATSSLCLAFIFNKNFFFAALMLSLTMLFKQNYAVGIFIGLFFCSLIDFFLTRQYYLSYIKVIVFSSAIIFLTIALADFYQQVSFNDFFEMIFFSASEQKGGLLLLIDSGLSTIYRTFNGWFIASFFTSLIGFFIYQKNKKNLKFLNLFIPISIYFFLGIYFLLIFSFLFKINLVMDIFYFYDLIYLRKFNSFFIQLIKYVSFIILIIYFLSFIGIKRYFENTKFLSDITLELDGFYLILLSGSLSLFMHLSSKVSNLVSYPNLLSVLGIIFVATIFNNKEKSLSKFFIYLISLMLFWNTFFAEKNGISLLSSKFEKVSNNDYAYDVRFDLNANDSKLYYLLINNLKKNETIQILPDNLSVSSLFNNVAIIKNPTNCSAINKFVDMFPDKLITSELRCFKENLPDYLLVVDEIYTSKWAEKFVRESSSGMIYMSKIIEEKKLYYDELEKIISRDVLYTLYKLK